MFHVSRRAGGGQSLLESGLAGGSGREGGRNPSYGTGCQDSGQDHLELEPEPDRIWILNRSHITGSGLPDSVDPAQYPDNNPDIRP